MRKNVISSDVNLMKEWDWEENNKLGINPSEITLGSIKKVNWICELGHKWQATANGRTSHGTGCPICASKKILIGFNDLASQNPKIAKEWHPIKNGCLLPTQVVSKSNKKVWWLCEKGHEWQAVISSRTLQGTGCSICANKRVLEGYNDLATTHPKIAKEWDYEKNNGLTPQQVLAGSSRKVWWVCEKGHEYYTTIYSRTGPKKTGCPKCAIARTTKASMKRLFCLETNKYYDSAKEVAKELHLDVVSVRKCARGKIENHKGFHFKYIDKSSTV